MTTDPNVTDVVVVGAGPAGCMANRSSLSEMPSERFPCNPDALPNDVS